MHDHPPVPARNPLAGGLRSQIQALLGRRPSRTGDTRRRRLPSGRTVRLTKGGLIWADLVAPGTRPTGGANSDRKHPSRKHDAPLRRTFTFTPSSSIAPAVTHGVRRRDRRPGQIRKAKLARRRQLRGAA